MIIGPEKPRPLDMSEAERTQLVRAMAWSMATAWMVMPANKAWRHTGKKTQMKLTEMADAALAVVEKGSLAIKDEPRSVESKADIQTDMTFHGTK